MGDRWSWVRAGSGSLEFASLRVRIIAEYRSSGNQVVEPCPKRRAVGGPEPFDRLRAPNHPARSSVLSRSGDTAVSRDPRDGLPSAR